MPRPAFLIKWFILSLLLITGCEKAGSDKNQAASKNPPKIEAGKNHEEGSGEKQGSSEKSSPDSRWLVSAEELNKELAVDLILDVRSIEEYEKEHLPGAIHVDLADWKKKSLEENGLNESEYWAKTLGGIGIGQDTNVVVYSENPSNAARATWLLAYQGVSHVSILDGGWKRWKEISGKTTDQAPEIKPAEFKPSAKKDWVITTKEVFDDLKTLTVADARSEVEYAGTGGKGNRKGHIPGAIRMEWSDLLNENGTYKSKEELQVLLKEKGFKPEQSVITHCQTGGRSSVNFIAFRLAGYPDIKNYYCGWSEWSANESHPIEKPNTEKPESKAEKENN